MDTKNIFGLLILVLLFSCNSKTKDSKPQPTEPDQEYHQAISLLGDTLYAEAPSEELQKKWIQKQQDFLKDTTNLNALIWYGRFTAYTGDYKGAIALYSEALEQFPNNSRLLRHRGHRYLSIRQFNKAIIDLEQAATQIQDESNSIEEDGMPNAQNIPLTTKHGNIYYHLGLAYYLNGEFNKSLETYKKCLELSQNNDGLVSATHWIVLNLKALDRDEEISSYLEPIDTSIEVIENGAYLNACLYYKGVKNLNELYNPKAEVNSSNSALKYGLARFTALQGDSDKATQIYADILSGKDWASFGYIAAEADKLRME